METVIGSICDMMDTLGYSHIYLPNVIQPIRLTDVMVGRAYPTIICDVYGEQEKPLGLLTEAIDNISEDEVYIVTGGDRRCSYFGEIMTATIKRRGAVGAVIDGYIRDTRQVLEQDFPVFCMGRDAQGSLYRNQVIRYGVPVEIGNILIRPGDLIFGDIDGVVVIPKEIEEKAITVTLEKVRGEKDTREAIERGMSAVEAEKKYGSF
ncbi:MAG TPA: RraA family protein [Brevefilum fermentans]|jgi:regulator of RNase E activity RraA|uniref:Putative 4-hydroxy-4-methyl-2-oxoglutarate aldolase n=1 Tax=Candidatus Brevifilum fermentans TaxID=1986204 RepID=A0A1Y6K4R7_9CHLR|nr:RraA family protein [Brevefilum fermentans]SMX53579.1 Demethylmenaquinone methyltransferase [Brevefilum fermentans]HOM67095.1 RraA family protein [Brevefilum fermentans]HPX95639.1 RraA family protein [Brevefilum fermentans]HQA28805.1 RraA family protein [Brevefilum fermentans]